MEENGGASFDISEVLIRISTLLAVGQYAKETNNITNDVKNICEGPFKTVSEYKDLNVGISDRIVDIFNGLN